MKKLFKVFFLTLMAAGLLSLSVPSSALAKNPDPPRTSKVTLKTAGAGALSFIVPGIGQAVNNNKGEKVLTHVILGFVFPPSRFWSCYDAVVDRQGGYWEGRI
ncbi:MAG: hypothetical protein ACD_20C00357G0036 [uncultured bacterium]|nr:MAG: hypothetical protein ACD_20C00357G0036 [uncultured bacterium]HBH17891.1 hypothetical protein [Cyanobacteria bacterium UBA9579]